MDLLKSLSKDNTVQYILTMIDDMLTGSALHSMSIFPSNFYFSPSFFRLFLQSPPVNSERVRLFHSKEADGFAFAPLLK